MGRVVRCLDTYALVEIAEGNKKFTHYLTTDFVIPEPTLAEFYGVILRGKDQHAADYWLGRLTSYRMPVDIETTIEAVRFRRAHRKAKLSFFDAVGYLFALKNRFPFVTGVKEFENLENVEFRKTS